MATKIIVTRMCEVMEETRKEIGKQIKKYRQELGLSQDELAEKIYVSRQTISNWENDKNYPDVKSLLLLANLFGISLDILIKGDLEKMKQEIKSEDIKEFGRKGTVYTIFFMLLLITPIPLAHFFGWWGLGIYLILAIVAFYFAIDLERFKKAHDIQTYKEILAFSEGRSLEELEKRDEKVKRPYQNVIKALIAAVLTFVVCAIMVFIFSKF